MKINVYNSPIEGQLTDALVVSSSRRTIGRSILNDPTDYRSIQLLSFEKDITWMRETTTTYIKSIRGEELSDSSAYNDFYGFFTSFEDPMVMAVRQSLKNPELEHSVVTTVVDFPAILIAESDYDNRYYSVRNKRQNVYIPIPTDWVDITETHNRKNFEELVELKSKDAEFTDIIDKGSQIEYLGQTEKAVVIWSSGNSHETNYAFFSEFLDDYGSALEEEHKQKLINKWVELNVPLSSKSYA